MAQITVKQKYRASSLVLVANPMGLSNLAPRPILILILETKGKPKTATFTDAQLSLTSLDFICLCVEPNGLYSNS